MNNKCQEINNPERTPHRNNQELTEYMGFSIYTCYGTFDTPYYTIVNEGTNVHVHSKSMKIAKRICEEANHFTKYGFFKTKQLDVRTRANKLALRQVNNKLCYKA